MSGIAPLNGRAPVGNNSIHAKRGNRISEQLQCAVPQNIHTPPTESSLFCTPSPPMKFQFSSYFAPRSLTFKTLVAPALEFLITFHGVGMDFFLELHNTNKILAPTIFKEVCFYKKLY